uniref:Uncharacterized protein n=1 Tax=viral metagenome TaxID=1070528 RepID=A0A6M3XFY9_9ZZZZ
MDKHLNEMFGVNNIWELGYFILYIFGIVGIAIIILQLDDVHSFSIGFALGMASVYIFKKFVSKKH